MRKDTGNSRPKRTPPLRGNPPTSWGNPASLPWGACDGNPPLKGSPRLDDFVFHVYMPHARERKRSWATDERIARKCISPFFGHRTISSLSAREISDWHDGLLESGYSPASCNRFLALFKTIMAMAERRGLVAESPCGEVKPFRIHAQRERFLSKREAALLMEALRGIDRPEARIITLLLLTGARKSEIVRARWEDVSLERRVLTVPLSKSGKPRQIVLSAMAMELLREMAAERSGPWLFPGRGGKRPLAGLDKFWAKLRKDLGLRDVRIHDLRHSFASFLVNAGHSLYEVQRLLGHRNPRTTMRYSHLGQESLVVAADLVGSLVTA